MDIDQLLDTLKNKVHPKYRVRHAAKDHEIVDLLMAMYPDGDLSEAVFLFINEMPKRPVCQRCGGKVSFFSNRFAAFCSKICSNAENKNYENMKAVLKEKHGVDNCNALPSVTAKRHKTMIERYGALVTVNHPSKNESTHERLNTKGRETLMERYGVTNPSQLPDHKEKMQTAALKRFNMVEDLKVAYPEVIDLSNFVQSILPNRIFTNVRDVIPPYELDIYIPDKAVAIEFCGLYYHNDDHKDADYHRRKMLLCRQKNIRLLQIFEDEWSFRQDVVKTRLKHILGVSEQSRIFARKCSIQPIDTKTARHFCEQHHLQGYAMASVRLGLFYDDTLVSVMTFVRLNIAKGHRHKDGWELSRFCSSATVVGGAGKLFRHFIKLMKPTEVMSYSDLRWNTGNLYERLGFTHSHESRPNYWYTKGEDRVYRFALRKTEMDDPLKSEKRIRKEEGWSRIYDCGNGVWRWSHTCSS